MPQCYAFETKKKIKKLCKNIKCWQSIKYN